MRKSDKSKKILIAPLAIYPVKEGVRTQPTHPPCIRVCFLVWTASYTLAVAEFIEFYNVIYWAISCNKTETEANSALLKENEKNLKGWSIYMSFPNNKKKK